MDPDSVPQPVPRRETRSRYGNPPSYQVFGRTYHVLDSSENYVERGIASWYGTKFQGRRTSSGEPYDMFRYTAAHKTLPLPTYARVTNLENGRSVIVRINDRGPFKDNRLIDLSYIAAKKLGYADKGTARVEVRAINPAEDAPASAHGDKRLWLQAGSFTERGNAENLHRKLAAAGLDPVRVTPVRVDGQTFYRVRIGPLASAASANELLQRIHSLGLGPARVLTE